ncbi:metalloregulator ArsR/SmtB family transcription factor [Cellulomonas fimi]|uniref:helix-turn-helix transcriptional regulator n=1 Tax=Cellulomonas fimi TaxID=1708 RepID=UPI001B863FB7|nr:helix-turn-helix domain-containing protein [Cellulomonas fimi]
MDDFVSAVAGVAALAEPVRRELYLFVVSQPEPVSRDQAAAGTGVERHTAKFHLDRLVRDGLLETESRRLTGRQGPGAGRPAKLYRRAAREMSVSLPDRRYELAGRLLARAVDDSRREGTDVLTALDRAAADAGAWLAGAARTSRGGATAAEPEATPSGAVPTREPATSGTVPADEVTSSGTSPRDEATRSGAMPTDEVAPATSPLDRACRVLADNGYEPRRDADTVTLANCPFHALAREHTELVCGMNLSLLGGLASSLDPGLEARLEPAPGRCCVVLTQR